MGRFRFDQEPTPMPEDNTMTFDQADDLRFSDLAGTRQPTEEGTAMRRAADAEATWTSACPKCGKKFVGSLAALQAQNAEHECSV